MIQVVRIPAKDGWRTSGCGSGGRWVAVLVVFVLVRMGWGRPYDPAAAAHLRDSRNGWTSRHVIVRVKPELVEEGRNAPRGQFAGPRRSLLTMTPSLQRTCGRWRVRQVRPAYPFEFTHPELASQIGLDRYFVLEVPAGTDAPRMANELRLLPGDIEFATVDVIGGLAEFVPNDAEFAAHQWNLRNTGQSICLNGGGCISGQPDADIDATDAWDVHTGDFGSVTIAFLDSGIFAHPDIQGRILPGINTNDPKNPLQVEDLVGHGTHVAGIAAAGGNNDIGVAGVTWGAFIMPIRVTDGLGGGTALHGANGLIWAADHGADVVNMSVQYYSFNNAPEDLMMLSDAVDYADALGVVLVGATGNNVGSTVAFPARYEKVIAVGATTNTDTRASFSNFGPEVDVSAPGDRVRSCWNDGGYRYSNGTSMAAPHVSGLAALILSYQPQLASSTVRSIIEETVDDLGATGWDELFGHGRINAHQALIRAGTAIGIQASFPPDGAIDARQPTRLDGSNPDGWRRVDITFLGPASGVASKDFLVTVDPPGSAPGVEEVVVSGSTVAVILDAPIPVGKWTTIALPGIGDQLRLGYLPGDVNGDGTSNVLDVTALIDSLNVVTPRPSWSTDLDRSGVTSPLDISREIDLLNGADSFDPYLGMSLP